MIKPDIIICHYESCWRNKAKRLRWKLGPSEQLPQEFRILVFRPSQQREMWTYATCGMSMQGDANPIEIHLFSPNESDGHIELLTAIAHYHLTGNYLDLGHTVNFGRPWLPGSECDHGLLSVPYLDGPKLEWLNVDNRTIRFLWLIPITPSESKFAEQNGLEALEDRFELARFNYLDPSRKSVI